MFVARGNIDKEISGTRVLQDLQLDVGWKIAIYLKPVLSRICTRSHFH